MFDESSPVPLNDCMYSYRKNAAYVQCFQVFQGLSTVHGNADDFRSNAANRPYGDVQASRSPQRQRMYSLRAIS